MALQENQRRPKDRRGVSAVEFAVVLPLVVLLLLGAVEVGRAVMVQHSLQEAAQAGCRIYASQDTTLQDAQEMIDTGLALEGISGYTTTFDPPNKANIDTPLEQVTVTVSMGYDQVSWIPAWFMSGRSVAGTCTMPADVVLD